MEPTGTGAAYSLGHSHREMDRLTAQARFFEPTTRHLFEAAGLRPGMRVLDVGSGSGDVAFLAASFVGTSGTVTAIDKSSAAVESARARARDAGISNVTFLTGNVAEMSPSPVFDAVVGRLVLMHQPNPSGLLRHLAKLVAPGGFIAFQEFDMGGARSYPRCDLYARCLEWIETAFTRAGTDSHLGLKLYSVFTAAGLPAPEMALEAVMGGGPGNPASALVPEVIRSLLPVLEHFQIAGAHEIEIETLRDRLTAEIVGNGAIVISPSLIGAWTRLPG